jgi:hypothetical protein
MLDALALIGWQVASEIFVNNKRLLTTKAFNSKWGVVHQIVF